MNHPTPTLSEPVSPVDHIKGPEHAPVTLIEYGDFECPGCRLAVPTVSLLLNQFPNKIRFIYRHFPLELAHPHAVTAAEAAECAAAQGRFWPMHDLLFEHQAHLKPSDLARYAAQLGLDMTRFAAEFGDHIYLQRIREQIDGGHRSHLRATPTFFINGVVHDVSFGMRSLHDAVASLLRS
jgi:protein-disulfide isomerase